MKGEIMKLLKLLYFLTDKKWIPDFLIKKQILTFKFKKRGGEEDE